MTIRWMVFDQQRCFGCNACVVACQQEYGLPADIRFNKVNVEVDMRAATHISERITFRPLLCNQCDNAPCLAICPVDAITRRADGVVVTDRVKCVGCRLCTTATGCPYGMRAIDAAGKAVKCDFCFDRLTATPTHEEQPYCVKTCPSKARQMVVQVAAPIGIPMESRRGASPKVFYGNLPV